MEIIRTVIHSDLKDIKKFRDRFIGVLKDKAYEEDEIFRMRLILDELTSNSYKHGNKKDIDKLIEVFIVFADRYFLIKVKDQGRGITRDKCQGRFAESGRGIDLVEKLSDKIIIDKNSIACLIRNS